MWIRPCVWVQPEVTLPMTSQNLDLALVHLIENEMRVIRFMRDASSVGIDLDQTIIVNSDGAMHFVLDVVGFPTESDDFCRDWLLMEMYSDDFSGSADKDEFVNNITILAKQYLFWLHSELHEVQKMGIC